MAGCGRLAVSWQLVAQAVIRCVASQTTATETVGCFLYGYQIKMLPIEEVGTALWHGIADKLMCQRLCTTFTQCKHWVYFKSSSSCLVGGNALEVVGDSDAVSGPQVCPATPAACTENPGPGFPGATVADSFSAWASGMQPTKLQCWPRGPDDSLLPCLDDPAIALEDVHQGWAAQCSGLRRVEPKDETCAESCERNLYCPAYQESISGRCTHRDHINHIRNRRHSDYAYHGCHLECWQGMGYRCNDTTRTDVMVTNAKRLMHGKYRVLMDLGGTAVNGLIPVSSPATDASLGIRACNHTCLSVLSCEMWQYSSVYGCYVNNPGESPYTDIGYPGTYPTVFDPARNFSSTVLAGEYIQRFCGPAPVASPESASRVITWEGSDSIAMPHPTTSIIPLTVAATATIPMRSGSASGQPTASATIARAPDTVALEHMSVAIAPTPSPTALGQLGIPSLVALVALFSGVACFTLARLLPARINMSPNAGMEDELATTSSDDDDGLQLGWGA